MDVFCSGPKKPSKHEHQRPLTLGELMFAGVRVACQCTVQIQSSAVIQTSRDGYVLYISRSSSVSVNWRNQIIIGIQSDS